MSSERRFFPASGNQTTEAGIRPSYGSNLYVVIGEPDGNGRWAVRSYWHPMVLFIWIGPLIMALGGLFSLTDRRFRIGAPSRRLAPVVAG
jgi:cytochrome c-type biogenesis protein CcmF